MKHDAPWTALICIFSYHSNPQPFCPGSFDDRAQVCLTAIEMKSIATFGFENEAFEVPEMIEHESLYLADKTAVMGAAGLHAPPIAAARREDGLRIAAEVANLS